MLHKYSFVVMWCQQWKIPFTQDKWSKTANAFGHTTPLLWCSMFAGKKTKKELRCFISMEKNELITRNARER